MTSVHSRLAVLILAATAAVGANLSAAQTGQIPSPIVTKQNPSVSLITFKILLAVPSAHEVDRYDGDVGKVSLILIDGKDGRSEVSLGYLESTPNVTGQLWRLSGWGALTTASLFLDRPLLRYRIAVEFDQAYPVDGPSASAMLTVALLATLNGHQLHEDRTMTGMIMPDGSIGAVGCIPAKLRAAKRSGLSLVLIPESVYTDAVGTLAAQLGIRVKPVVDIYAAYEDLVQPDQAQRPRQLKRVSVGGVVASLEKVDQFFGERAAILIQTGKGLQSRWKPDLLTSINTSMRSEVEAVAEKGYRALMAAEKAKMQAYPSLAYEKAFEAIRYYHAALQYVGANPKHPLEDLNTSGLGGDRDISNEAMEDQRATSETLTDVVGTAAEASYLVEHQAALARYISHKQRANRDWEQAVQIERGGDGKTPDKPRAELIRLRAFFHEAYAVTAAIRARDLPLMWDRIKDSVRPGFIAAHDTWLPVIKLFRVSTDMSGRFLLASQPESNASPSAQQAATVSADDLEREAIALAIGDVASADQKSLGNLAASIDLYVRASALLARSYALTPSSGGCSKREISSGLSDSLIAEVLRLASVRATEALMAAKARDFDAPLAYHYYQYAQRLMTSSEQADRLAALEAFWRANAHARVLLLLSPPTP